MIPPQRTVQMDGFFMGFDLEISVPALTVFIQGILSFFSPCVLPLVPLYVAIWQAGPRRWRRTAPSATPWGRVMWNTLIFCAGDQRHRFSCWASASPLWGRFFSDNRLWFARISGIIMVLFGLYQLGCLDIPWR